jgi:AcrR family transcriptional regulator
MSDEVKPKRRYRSPVRDERRRATRHQVLTAAIDLFVAQGYGRTAVQEVAARAGVSAETVYATVGPKPVLLRAAIEEAIEGPDAVAPLDQPWVEVVRGLPTAGDRLQAYVHENCAFLSRTSALHAVIRGAADQEDVAVEIRNELLARRLASHRRLIQLFLGGDLRAGLTLSEAADRYTALSSPELHHLCVEGLGWTLDQHERWLLELARRELLGD